ncbi:MAG: VOC family protein [Bacteroidales bacterium]|jgi:methylmalonyl-CoA/ethylmalonyl-CoA epimerase|nr:VOC family protein [Bacteroidales bacterium]
MEHLTFHHIGMATDSIEHSSKLYIEAGFRASETILDPVRKVRICFLTRQNHPDIELIEPAGQDAPVCNYLKKNGVGPYHLCYRTTSMDGAVRRLKGKHFILLGKPAPACAIHNRPVCFMYHRNIGLIELVEEP